MKVERLSQIDCPNFGHAGRRAVFASEVRLPVAGGNAAGSHRRNRNVSLPIDEA